MSEDNKEIKQHEEKINKLIEKIDFLLATKPKETKPSDAERLAELEIKMAKLWSLLISNNNAKKEDRITKEGKKFGSVLLS